MKDDRVYLIHILRCISRIEEYTVAGREAFFASHLVQDGVIRNLQTLAESSQRLSEGIKVLHPAVDWRGLAGFRNVLVHDYLGVDLEYVYRAVDLDMGRLKLACEEAIQRLAPPV
ncbi:MAG: HepT-like ribonuclease domain-containing protein [Thermoanaerobaculia bacterium]